MTTNDEALTRLAELMHGLPTMNVEALTRLAALMRAIPARLRDPEKFDLSHWCSLTYDDKGHVCGTAACAGGWAALDPWFQERGLKLSSWRIRELGTEKVHDIPSVVAKLYERWRPQKGQTEDVGFILYFDGEMELHACRKFFGISHEEARCIFLARAYGPERHNPILVAERIEGLLAVADDPKERADWASYYDPGR